MSADPSRGLQIRAKHIWAQSSLSQQVAVDVASKENLTGSGCHLRNVKIIRWIDLNEKLMDFKAEGEFILTLH